jgi:hypothetical protein
MTRSEEEGGSKGKEGDVMTTNRRDLLGSLWAIVAVLSWAGMILWLMYNWR